MKEMTMWQELRKNYTNYTLDEIGKLYKNNTRQQISQWETGKIGMPADLKIIYLGFRNNEKDKILIECLKEKVVK